MTEALEQEIRTLRALQSSERDPEGRVFAPLADAYRRAGRIPEAVQLLNEGLTRLPDFVTGHVVAAQLYVEQGLAEEAGLAARRALELDPDNVCALRSLLRVLDEKGELHEAREVRDQLMGLEPDFLSELSTMTTVTRPALPAVAPPSPRVEAGGALELGAVDEVSSDAEKEPDGGRDRDRGGELANDALDTLTFSPAGANPPRQVEDELAPEGPVFEMGDLVRDDEELTLAGEPETAILEGSTPEPPWPGTALDPLPEPVFDLDSLVGTGAGTEQPLEEELVEDAPTLAWVGDLPEDEPVFEMEALGPDEAEEPVLEMAALAPDEAEEPVLEMAALAPDEAEEPVLEMAALAPDEAEEPVLEMAALAPDEPAVDLDVAATDGNFSPGPEHDIEIDLPSPEQPDEVVFDMDVLRPDGVEEVRGGGDGTGPGSLPSSLDGAPAEGATLFEAESLAEDDPLSEAGPPSDDETTDDREAPETAAPDRGAEEPDDADPDRAEGDEEGAGEPVYTWTLAELYVTQGAVDRAVGVLRHLLQSDPMNEELVRRIAQLEEGDGAVGESPTAGAAHVGRHPRAPHVAEDEPEEEVESLARELAESGDEGHEVDSPFSWSEEEVQEAPVDGPTIRDYFEGLLAWEAGEGRE